ncbi:MAG: DUF1573 domain-containing protein [Bacteroidetes bacterium]|nr:DUF1573 domain-containing protein [Bacteroidota bacterium]
MKKSVLFLSLVLFTFFALNAQPITTSEPSPNTVSDGAEITFSKKAHDFGTVQIGSEGSCEFKFTNTGKGPLILSNVTATCGCTVPSWPKEPILPGKTGTIKVNYTKMDKVGTFNKQITVFSNTKEGNVVLTVKGNVIDKTSAKP